MASRLNEIRHFKSQITDIEDDIHFSSLREHPSYLDYKMVKNKVLRQLDSGKYTYTDIQQDIDYMETFVGHFYKS